MAIPHQHCVLLVDDQEDMRRALALYLDAKGYEAHGAVDAADALLLLATGLRPCCAVIDVVMPDMDGWTLIERLRADPISEALPIVLYSGHLISPEEAMRVRALGVCACLLKPVDPRELLATLVEHCHSCG